LPFTPPVFGAGVIARASKIASAARRPRAGLAGLSLTSRPIAVLAGIAALLLLIMLVLLPEHVFAARVLAGVAAAVVLATLHLALTARTSAGERERAGRLEQLGEALERRLETLQDLRWQLSENEARYRDLLDTQSELIVRHNADGELTFANRSFARAFGAGAAVLGCKPALRILEGEGFATGRGGAGPRTFVQLAETSAGPRWIAWEETLLVAADGRGYEVQCVGRDVTEARRAEAMLREARDQAESASRAKSRFLAAMSHEIRTPMNGIMGMASLLRETVQTPEQATYVHAIDQSARTLLTLIDEILDFSKIEAGKLVLQNGAVNLSDVVQSAVELLAPRAHEKGLELAWAVDGAFPELVLGDEARLRQIMLNLLSNAVKFTDRGGISVRLRAPVVEQGRAEVAIEVADTGIGLSLDDMAALFTEFEQAEAALRRRTGGTGLGLAISKGLARAMGGDIAVESEQGRGSTFTLHVTFDVVRARAASREGIIEAGEGIALGPVLLAFDRAIERRALAATLDRAGIEVVETELEAASDAVAAAAAAGTPFEHVLVDVTAPVAKAGALLEQVKAARKGKARGIVLINLLSRASLQCFRDAGFEAYLVRPVRPASLLRQLRGAFERPSAAAPGPAPGAPVLGGHVLLVEDNDINALLADRVLTRCGCTLERVASGEAAVEAMRAVIDGARKPYDLVLMDIFLPGIDGVEATSRILARWREAGGDRLPPPIVALTANAFVEDRQRYAAAGMADYLSKPFDKAALEGLLARWLERPAEPKAAPGAPPSAA
jgi:signal transduction histidine kinase/CheY-like chemotaxis protein